MIQTNGQDRATLIEFAKLAEQTERYKDMCRFIDALVEMRLQAREMTTDEERNLFSVAHGNTTSKLRAAWRVLSSAAQQGGSTDESPVARYREQIKAELAEHCTYAIGLCQRLVKGIVTSGDARHTSENSVFYHKMIGDYYRYQVEVCQGPARDEHARLTAEGARSTARYFFAADQMPGRARAHAALEYAQGPSSLDTPPRKLKEAGQTRDPISRIRSARCRELDQAFDRPWRPRRASTGHFRSSSGPGRASPEHFRSWPGEVERRRATSGT